MQRDRNMQIGGCPEISLKLVSRQWDYGYSELLRLVDVPMLSERRLRLKLAQVFKIVHKPLLLSRQHLPVTTASFKQAGKNRHLYIFARTNYY